MFLLPVSHRAESTVQAGGRQEGGRREAGREAGGRQGGGRGEDTRAGRSTPAHLRVHVMEFLLDSLDLAKPFIVVK